MTKFFTQKYRLTFLVQLDGQRSLVVGAADGTWLVGVIDSSGLIIREILVPGTERSVVKLSDRYAAIITQDEDISRLSAIKIKIQLLDIQSMVLSDVPKGEHVFSELPDPYQVGHPIKRRTSYVARSVTPGQLIIAFGDAVLNHGMIGLVKVERGTTIKSFTLTP